ncbi:PDR/VanB family oxidoreductase [Nocardia sp. alder85J]|uniref:PDR/VanB family oxidoreductase n=1 Tax=Nocardia sp. alder85J TaxID=2862949 RepID=UPI001CD7F497|nr:PDR/VanB family oxidoreductase [Nocardia sp. alder85J]MCX4092383.1 PDR/VanB family oxidoreductase [Nocardia sp. alder85J]
MSMPTPLDAQANSVPGAVAVVRVAEKRAVAENVVALDLVAPSGQRLPDWAPGAHIDLVLPNGQIRQYSLCGDRWDPHRYRVAVLREPDGRGGSAFVHDRLAVGDLVGVGGPRNNFAVIPSPEYLFVAGGIGITPLLPMLDQAERVGAAWKLLYGGRRRASMAFTGELARFGDRVLVAPEDECGRLDLRGFLGAPRSGVKIYACGPAPLLDALTEVCAGWPRYTLHTERFAGRDDAAAPRTSFDVRLARTGITVTVPPERTILDAVAAAGVEVLSSCRQGTCGTCETTVLAGRPDHRDAVLEDHERDAGDCLFVCVSRSRSDILVLDL